MNRHASLKFAGNLRAKSAGRRRSASAVSRAAYSEPLESRVLLAVGLVAAYGFEENTGTTTSDISGSGNLGTLNGATWTTSGKYGNALSFNGTNNTVTVADANSLHLTTGMTLEAWVFPTIATGTRDVIIKQGANVDIYNLYARDDQGFTEANVFIGNSNRPAIGVGLAVNVWSHLAGTFDGSTVRLYINGVQAGSFAATGSISTSTGVLRIGGNSLWGEWFQGRIDEVRVYNRALSAGEIATDMQSPVVAGSGANPTPPVVSAVTPIDTSINAGGGVNATALFNEAIDTSTINSSTFELRDPLGALVPSVVTYNSTTLTATLNPTPSLTNTSDFYVARIHGGASGVKDIAGDPLAADYTWSFCPGSLNLTNETLITNINFPTVMVWLPDGRMLVGSLMGRIDVAQPGATQVDATPLMQLTNINNDQQDGEVERGLNGMCIDPNFSSNHYIYVFYTANTPLRNRVSRFTVTGNTADPASEFVVWQDNNPPGIFHQGGGIVFGTDGKLYITTGDNWDDPSSAQSLTSYHGKVLRVNSDGSIPTDNPFFDGAGPNLDAIWAIGLRNPFHNSVDPVTGRFFIGDVGGNDPNNSYEELDLGARGANYGWPLHEGPGGGVGLTDPIFSYIHAGRDACIVAGFVYRGNGYPAALQGSYFYGDYARNTIRRLSFDASGNVTGDFPVAPADGSMDQASMGDPVCLTVGPDGAIYYVDFGYSPTANPATIRRLSSSSINRAPVVVSSASPVQGLPPLTVNFSSAGTNDPENQPLTYSWNFGDGTSSTQPNPSHIYTTTGPYSARVSVSDGVNTTLGDPIAITVGRPPVPTITSPTNGILFHANDVIHFAGTGFDPDDGNLPASAFTWDIVFHHDTHIHPILGPLSGVTSGTLTIPNTGHDFSDQTSYEIILTVTDSNGLQGVTSVTIYPDKVNLTFSSTPPGTPLLIDGLPHTTPFVLDSLKGFLHTIEAVTPATVGTSQYDFTSWSDGGARLHTVTTPETDATYMATYTLAPLPGPVAAYNFDEASGSTVLDVSGNANNGTITGATRTASGKHSGALSFNGTSNLVTVADSNSLDLTNGMTLEAWIFPTASSGTRDVIIKEGPSVDYYNLYQRDGSGTPEGNVYVSGLNRTAQGATLPINTWTHLATTYDGTTLILYVNGAQAASTNISGTIAVSTGALRIGGNSLWGEWFQGMIDDVRIYSRALSTSEISTDMATPVSSLPVNHAPTAVIGANPTSGAVPLVVNFNSTGSGDPDAGDTITYAWDLDNDGQFNDGTASTAQFTFTTAGTKTVRLQVTDNHGLSSVATTTISVTNPNNQLPTMIIDTPASSLPWKVGDGISFSGHATDPEDVNVATSGLNWQFILHQGASTQVLQTFNGVSSGTFTVPNEPYPSTLEIKATATDSSGGQGTSSVTINPQIVSLNFATSPTGLQLSVNGTISTAPFSRTVIVNSVNAVIATSPQTLNSTNYFFANWSDSGAATHNITAPASTATYTATYTTAAGPVAAYNFNAGSGTTLADITGNGNNGTIAGASWITTGHSGGALNFTADGQMVTVADSASLHLSTGMTLEAWIFPTINTGTRDVLIKEGSTVDIYNMYHRNDAGKAEANVFAGGSNRTAQANPPAINTWTHLAATYDGTNVRLFVNGVQAAITPFAGTIATSTGALRMGGNSLWGEWFRGRMDDVRIYNRALTAAEITTDMNTAVAASMVALPASLNDGTTPPMTTPPGTNSGSVFNRRTPIRVSSLIDLVDTV